MRKGLLVWQVSLEGSLTKTRERGCWGVRLTAEMACPRWRDGSGPANAGHVSALWRLGREVGGRSPLPFHNLAHVMDLLLRWYLMVPFVEELHNHV